MYKIKNQRAIEYAMAKKKFCFNRLFRCHGQKMDSCRFFHNANKKKMSEKKKRKRKVLFNRITIVSVIYLFIYRQR